MRFLIYIWVLILLVATGGAASAQSLTSISVVKTSSATEVQLNFDSSAREADKMFMIPGEKPRLVLDFEDSDFSLVKTRNRVEGQGLVQAVRFARRGAQERDMRIVVDLKSTDVRSTPFISGNSLTLILQKEGEVLSTAPQTIQLEAVPAAPPTIVITQAAPEQVTTPRYFRDKMPFPRIKPSGTVTSPALPPRKPVIVIDPGHGGYDPGAIGVAGTKEKKITYAASLELQRQLMATGRYSVIITRSKDIYVPHEERLRIARAGGADLFISIHADATASGSARGASVYTLADRAITRSKRIVSSQNWIMDVDLSEQSDPVGDILVDLAQRKTATQSDEFAEVLISELGKTTKLIGNTHRRAGYFVLLAPDVPAVLLELGFLSNAEDEKLLNDKAHRKNVVSSVTRAINLYFDKQKS